MSPQADYIVANGTGAAVRSDINGQLAAIVSNNSGATEPATMYAYQWWADTTTGLLKLRNSANSAWISLFQLDGEWTTLPIENGTAAAPSIYFKDSGTDTGIYSPGADQVAISTGGTVRTIVDSSGRMLVGTSTYTGNGKLVAAGNTGGSAGTLDICSTGSRPTAADTDIGYIRWYVADNSSSNAHYASIYASSDGASSSVSDIPGRLVFSTTADGGATPTERMRITQGGNLCINSTGSDNSTGGPLCITGRGTQGMSTWNIGTNGYAALYFNNASGSKVGDIVVNSGGTAYNTTSDYRLKENIVPLTGAVDRLNQLQVHRFNFIADPDTTVDGFIAHEAQEVVPECATGTKDEVDDEGNPVYQGIDQSKLVPLLTAALQEAIAKIEALETRLSALEAA